MLGAHFVVVLYEQTVVVSGVLSTRIFSHSVAIEATVYPVTKYVSLRQLMPMSVHVVVVLQDIATTTFFIHSVFTDRSLVCSSFSFIDQAACWSVCSGFTELMMTCVLCKPRGPTRAPTWQTLQ